MSQETSLASENIVSGKYLSFTLGSELYAVAVGHILEIIRDQRITPVPGLPMHFKGVINLRGKVVPVVDLRIRFNLPTDNEIEKSCMLVSQAYLKGGDLTTAALIVDAVDTVMDISNCSYEETPDLGGCVHKEWTHGIIEIENKSLTLLNLDRLLSDELENL